MYYPISETPMTQARINAQYAFGARVGRHFDQGNRSMANLVDSLTPPAPTGTCDDLTSSDVFDRVWPMAWPPPPGFTVSGGGTYAAAMAAASASAAPAIVATPPVASAVQASPAAGASPVAVARDRYRLAGAGRRANGLPGAGSPGYDAYGRPMHRFGSGRRVDTSPGALAPNGGAPGSGPTATNGGASPTATNGGTRGPGGTAVPHGTPNGGYGRGVPAGSIYPRGPLQATVANFSAVGPCPPAAPGSASAAAAAAATASSAAAPGSSSSILWGLLLLFGIAIVAGSGDSGTKDR